MPTTKMFQGYGYDGEIRNFLKSQQVFPTHTSCTRRIKEDLQDLLARVSALEG